MDDRCRKIVEELKRSHTKADIVRFFKENPYAMDLLSGLAIWVFRPQAQIAADVDGLVSLGVLRRFGEEPGAVYAYTKDGEVRDCIDEHWPEIDQAARKLRASHRAER